MRARFSATASSFFLVCAAAFAQPTDPITPAQMKEEAVIFTPPGFNKVGEPKWDGTASWSSAWTNNGRTGLVEVIVRDAASGELVPCRVNVVGPDGNFYQPPPNRLSRFALTGTWSHAPNSPGGNRPGKAPFRYLGRCFYITGPTKVRAPAGSVRIEVWRGYEYRPETVTVQLAPGATQKVEVKLTRGAAMAAEGYYAGDTHLHFARETEEDDNLLFDMLAMEDLRYGVDMAWNPVPKLYAGFMDRLTDPQRSIGRGSIRTRGDLHVVSGQEYRSKVYGHLNLSLRDDLAVTGREPFDTDTWPVFGEVGRETIAGGGFAFMAHGGYDQEVYADAALGTVSGIELLQFGIYRHVGLENWYNILNSGCRFAAHGASDWPGTRWLADCRTYVYHATAPTLPEWLAGVAAGRSFFTSGPLLLLEVNGEKPGAQIRKTDGGPHRVTARVRMRCEVTSVTDIDLIVNGRTVKTLQVPAADSKGRWIELQHMVELNESSWIAARAHSKSPGGEADAEAHTNPVYVYLNNRAPFNKVAIDAWIAKIDGQIAIHAKRIFPENAKVLNYFQQARDVLLRIRAQGGLSADEDPARLLAGGAAPGLRNLALDGSVTDATDEEIKAYLTSVAVPPTTPAQAIKSFETVGGFEMQLVAAEPLIRSPIVAAFDENGNMYVGEMTDYPYNSAGRVRVSWQRESKPDEKPTGSVRLLRDTDGDGVYDQSTVFAGGLLWVGGIVPWKGGVFVTAPPDIWYLKDTDGDGKADIREKVFSGFGMERQQQFVNSLIFGLDHKIYASTGGNGGDIRPGNDPAAKPVVINNRDFCFEPEIRRLELQTGTHQFGMSFDDWGSRFLCDQANPGFHVVLPLRYLERNPYYTPRATMLLMAPPSTPVFRISPVEGWRHIKSSRRVAGTDRAADIVPVVGQARIEAQHLTDSTRNATNAGVSNHVIDATAGVTVYRGGAYPKEYYGDLFTGDSLGSLVHRRKLVADGAAFRSERSDENTEFVRTSDNWFKPVNFANAPDGTLYCIDMAREYSESANIPPDVEKQMDLQSGKDRGRIYRIAPPGFRQPPPPRLSKATTVELVRALENPHGWWRDTAHRLLYERQDKSAVPALERIVYQSKSPQARVHALWSLDGLGALGDRAILAGLSDEHPGVRENALRLAESRLDASGEIRERIPSLVSDPEPRVRLQLVFTLGDTKKWDQAGLLARLARENLDDSWVQSAIISSAAECGGELMAAIAGDAALFSKPKAIEFLRQLVTTIGFQNRSADVTRVIETVVAIRDSSAALALLGALGEGLKLAGTNLTAVDRAGRTRSLLQQAPAIAMDDSRPELLRRSAIEILGMGSYASAAPTLAALLAPGQSAARQQAAIKLLRQFTNPEASRLLIERYANLTLTSRTQAIDALLERADRVDLLLIALKNKSVPRGDLSVAQVSTLRHHADEHVRERAIEVLGVANSAKRQDVVRGYLASLDMPGDAGRGRSVFQSRCAACHLFAGIGLAFGPDLSGVGSGGKQKLLTSILDPNRDVAPDYFFHTVETKDGGSTAGIMKNETATSVTLLQVGGVSRTIAKENIARSKVLRQSLMPEGLESGLNQQDMADLIEFLINPGK